MRAVVCVFHADSVCFAFVCALVSDEEEVEIDEEQEKKRLEMLKAKLKRYQQVL